MKKEKSDLYEGIGCGCMIIAVGIVFFLFAVASNLTEIIKIIWK
jgi:hypothetical protein